MSESWFTVRSIGPGVWLIQEPIGQVAPMFDVATVNMYLVAGSERAAIIDSGMGMHDLAAVCRTLTDLPVMNLCTHSHWDHVGSSHAFAERLIHPLEADRLNRAYAVGEITAIQAAPATGALTHGMTIDLGGRSLTVWHTPGHSPGHVSLLDSDTGFLFCADVCYAGTMWLQTEDADLTAWESSLRCLAAPAVRALCGGHEEPLQPPSLAGRVLAGLQAARAGTSDHERFAPQEGVRKHRFDGFSILFQSNLW